MHSKLSFTTSDKNSNMTSGHMTLISSISLCSTLCLGSRSGFMPCTFHCDRCSARFQYSSARVARSCRDRHIREEHGKNSVRKVNVQKRRDRDREYKQKVRRTSSSGDGQDEAEAWVICPDRREEKHRFFSLTKAAFVAHGAPAHCVRRVPGWDLQDPQYRHLERHAFLHEYFCTSFLDQVLRAFDQNQNLKVVFWVEAWFRKGNQKRTIELHWGA